MTIFFVTWFSPGYDIKGLGNLFVIFSVDIWLFFSVAISYMLRADIYFLHNTVKYIGCYLDSDLNEESVAFRVLKKINKKLNFLWRQSNYLKYSSRWLLCNALVQPHFEYGCTSWYPLLNKALKTKLQIAQSKCIRFCLELRPRS